MAARKPLFMGTEGFQEEMALADSMTLGALTIGSGGDITVSGDGELVGLPTTPSGDTAAASKAYVDAVAQGLQLKGSCLVVEVTSNIDVSTGTLGLTIDSIDVDTDGMRVLLDAQTDASENGIWVAHSGAWTRPVDFAAGSHAAGAFTFVEQGTVNADTGWVCVTDGPTDVVDTNDLDFTQFSSAGIITAGNGLAKSGSSLSVKAGDGIETSSNTNSTNVDLAANYGLQMIGTSPNKEVGILANGAAGIAVDSSGVKVLVESDGAIVFDGTNGGLEIKLEASNPTMQIATNALGVKLDTARAITTGASGIGVNLNATNPGLAITTNALDVKYNAAGAIEATATGIAINLEATNPTLDIVTNELGVKFSTTAGGLDQDAAGLKVKVDDSTIKINGSGQIYASGSAEAERIENTMTTATDTTANGDPVYANGVDTVGKADADVDAKSRVLGVIRTGGGAAGATPDVVTVGIAAGILTGATANTPYYLQSGGGIGTSLPGAGKRVIVVGYAINATDLFVRIVDYGKKAA